MTAPSPVAVQPGLWISGIDGLYAINELGITHVVSIINWRPLEAELFKLKDCKLKHIDLEDVESSDLLQHLPSAVAFISEALSSNPTNKVLVHCNQGVSRSAAVVVAYLLHSQQCSVADALAVLTKAYPSASPNSGFLSQLELFHAMGCAIDSTNMAYKRYMLEQAGHRYNSTGYLDASTLSEPTDDGTSKVALYRCRKCRCLICTAHNVVETEQGPGETAFSWRKRDKYSTGAPSPAAAEGSNTEDQSALRTSSSSYVSTSPRDAHDGSVFVEPLLWMKATVEGAVQGKLYCPKCNSRLGSFNWSGTQTASGAWVTPAFQLHLGKLDTFDPSAPLPPSLVAIRQPKILGSSSAPTNGTPPVSSQQSLGGKEESSPYFTHLIFDCDGVLVDSERASCESLYLSIKEVTGFEIPHEFPMDYRPVFGMDVTNCVRYYKETYGKKEWGDVEVLGPRVAKVKEVIYKELTKEGVTAFPGVLELVAQAKALGMGIAVASSGIPEKIAHNLGTAGLVHLFDPHLVVSATYVARGKPYPDVYLEALKRVGCVDASRAVVIEDAVNGLKAAREAGCFTIGVETSLPKEVLAPWADCVVPNIQCIDLSTLKPISSG